MQSQDTNGIRSAALQQQLDQPMSRKFDGYNRVNTVNRVNRVQSQPSPKYEQAYEIIGTQITTREPSRSARLQERFDRNDVDERRVVIDGRGGSTIGELRKMTAVQTIPGT